MRDQKTMGVILGYLILIVVGFILLPVIDASVATYALGPDGTAASGDEPSATILSLAALAPLFTILLIVGAGVAHVTFVLRGAT